MPVYIPDRHKDNFLKLEESLKAHFTVLLDVSEKFRVEKNEELLQHIRVMLVFNKIAMDAMINNKIIRSFDSKKDISRSFVEEISDPEFESKRYPYMMNRIGRNVMFGDFEQKFITANIFQQWYIEEKLNVLKNIMNQDPELKNIMKNINCFISSAKRFTDAWSKTLPDGFLVDENIIEIKNEDVDHIFEGVPEYKKIKKIVDSGIKVLFKDIPGGKQRFLTSFNSSSENPFAIIVDDGCDSINELFSKFKKLDLLSGVHTWLFKPVIKKDEKIFNLITKKGIRVGIDDIYGNGGYVFCIKNIEIVETDEKELAGAYVKLLENSITIKAANKEINNTFIFEEKPSLVQSGVGFRVGITSNVDSKTGRVTGKTKYAFIINDMEYIATNSSDVLEAARIASKNSVIATSKTEV